MADIRIKDLATTASTTASDDFMAVDGTTNGTRKLSAATPSFATSVTVPGVSGPTATALTLAGGSSGASLVLGQGTNASTVFTGTGTGLLSFTKTTGNPEIRAIAPAGGAGVFRAYTPSTSTLSVYGIYSVLEGNGNKWENGFYGTLDYVHRYNDAEKWRFTTTGNLLIGGTTDITGTGGLKVAGTSTASSTTSGALQVGSNVGLSGNAGGASYFGGNVVSSGYFSAAPGTGDFRFNQQSFQRAAFAMGGSHIGYGYNSRYDGSSATVPATDSTGTMSSIASTASGISIFTNTSQVANTPGVERFNVNSTGIVTVSSSTPSTGVATGALQVAGGIYAGENSVFSGDRLLARKDQNAVTRLQVRNDTSGTSAQSQVSATLGDFTTYTAMGSLSAGFTTSGLFAANAGYIASNATAGMNLFTVGATSLTLGTNGTAALTLASTGAATFAGAVSSGTTSTSGTQFDASATGASSSSGGAFIRVGVRDGAALGSGDRLGGVLFNGSTGASTDENSVAIFGYANDTWSAGVAPGRLDIDIAPAGSATRVNQLRLTATTATFAGAVTVSSSTASTNTTSGAFVVTGGVGVGGALNVGGAVTVNGTGTSTISSATTGAAGLMLRNTAAGAGNYGILGIGNDSDANAFNIITFSSTYSGSGANTANFSRIENNRASAGLNLVAGGAGGTVNIYAGGEGAGSKVATFSSTLDATFAGAVAIGNTVNTVSPTSPNRTVTMVIGGVTYYLAAKTTND